MPPAGLTQDLDGLWKKAEVRHADACSTCHGAPKASAHTANGWAGQLPKRGGRTGDGVRMALEDRKSVV